MRAWLATLLLGGCVEGVTQVAGTGAIYTTRCSADMDPRGDEYRARCIPEACRSNYQSAAVSHVVVALDPGRKIVGFAERTCVQDLSQATALFQPMPAEGPPEPGDAPPADPAPPEAAPAAVPAVEAPAAEATPAPATNP
jgi:hypothetical protein